MVGNMTWWYNNNDYLKLTTSEGTYPDAIEYKEGGQLWVQTWDHLYAVNKQTGVEFDDPIHRLYLLNKDASKIVYIAEYNNQNTYRTRNNAWPGNDRENGTKEMIRNYLSEMSMYNRYSDFWVNDIDDAFTILMIINAYKYCELNELDLS